MSVFLRFLVETSKKAKQIEKEKGEGFELKKYFDFVHLTRWLIHLITAFILLIILPQIFISVIYHKYEIGIDDWTLFGSAVVGFVG